jgi:hypothetical protein
VATFAPFDPRSSEPKTRPRKKAQNSDTSERLARTRTAQWYAQFYAQHGEHPSHIDEVGEHAAEFQPAPEASDRATDITIASFRAAMMQTRNTNDVIIDAITLTAVNDEHARSLGNVTHRTAKVFKSTFHNAAIAKRAANRRTRRNGHYDDESRQLRSARDCRNCARPHPHLMGE